MNKVKFFRERKGWTQEKLAAESGVTQSTISRIENDSSKYGASSSHLRKIAKALGISAGILLEDEEEEIKSA